MLLRYYVTTLIHYYVTTLLRYYVTTLLRYYVIMLLRYKWTNYVIHYVCLYLSAIPPTVYAYLREKIKTEVLTFKCVTLLQETKRGFMLCVSKVFFHKIIMFQGCIIFF